MKCNRCLNTNPTLFYEDEFGIYCRRCVSFGRFNINEKLKKTSLHKINHHVDFTFPYDLSEKQLNIASKGIEILTNQQDLLIHASCGAGKTEMIVPIITHFLNQGKSVGITIPRRQVVLELRERLSKIFKTLDIVAVCKDYTRKTKGDLIICTTHQLYRYVKCFDILIIDEIDAFPFHDNEVLQNIAKNSFREHLIALTATMSQSLWFDKSFQVLKLYERYHKRKLIVPKQIKLPFYLQLIYLLYFINKNKNLTCLIFVPTIDLLNTIFRLLSYYVKCFKISSESEDKEKILAELLKSSRRILLTTTIMERGITIADATVLVLNSEHVVYNEASLIQIAGRVDRKPISYNGEVIFLCSEKVQKIKTCIAKINEMNEVQA